MKKSVLTVILCLSLLPIAVRAQLPAKLKEMTHSQDTTYGYSSKNPICFKTGSLKGSLQSVREFLSHLSADGAAKFSIVTEEQVELLNEYNYIYFAGGKMYVVPKQTSSLHRFTLSDGQKEITLYVEPAMKIPAQVPVGLRLVP